MTDYRIRISRPIIGHLEGTSAWQEPHKTLPDGRPYCHPAEITLMAKVKAASVQSDGAVLVALTDAERQMLYEHTEVQIRGARDNAKDFRPGEPNEYLGELNACRALLRKLEKISDTERKVERLSRVK
jgi:hypothetical protein